MYMLLSSFQFNEAQRALAGMSKQWYMPGTTNQGCLSIQIFWKQDTKQYFILSQKFLVEIGGSHPRHPLSASLLINHILMCDCVASTCDS